MGGCFKSREPVLKAIDLACAFHSSGSMRSQSDRCRSGRIPSASEVFAMLLLASCPAGLWQLPAPGRDCGVASSREQVSNGVRVPALSSLKVHQLRELKLLPQHFMMAGGFGAAASSASKPKKAKGKKGKKRTQTLGSPGKLNVVANKRQPLTAVSNSQPLPSVALPNDVAAQHELPAPTTAEEIIPRDLLFQPKQYVNPLVSPDGKLLAYSRLHDSGLWYDVWCRTIGQNDDRVLLSVGSGERDKIVRIANIFWAQDSKTLLYLKDVNGDECFHLWSLDVSQMSPVSRDLTPFENITTREVIMNKHFPKTVLISLRKGTVGADAIAYRCDLESGNLTLDMVTQALLEEVSPFKIEDPNLIVVNYEVDEESFEVCAVKFFEGVFVRIRNESSWTSEWYWTAAVDDIIAVAKDGKSVLALSSQGRETAALVRVDLQNPNLTETIASNDKCECTEVLLDEDTKEVLSVSFDYGRKERIFFDKELEAEVRRLEAAAPPGAEVSIYGRDFHIFNLHDNSKGLERPKVRLISRGRSGQRWQLLYWRDNGPMEHLLYDCKTAATTRFFPQSPMLKYKFAHMEDVRIVARDGTELVAYLTRADAQKATPLVLKVHGGPASRDVWGFDPEDQWLANRGYAVLRVNFRGSLGYGKSFVSVGFDRDQWGIGVMQHDLTDAVAWAIKEGVALEDKICIFGHSYGGYASFAGMSFTPGLYACGVSMSGLAVPPFEGEMNISPLHHVNKVRSPILIAHGEKDPRVKKEHSDLMAFSLQKKELDVEYLSYAFEGHELGQFDNRMDFHGRMEHFLARHLGGRAEAFWKPNRSTVSFPLSKSTIPCSIIIPTNATKGQEVYYDLGPRGGHRRVRFVVPKGTEPGALIPECIV